MPISRACAPLRMVLDQETERVRHDAGLKVVPPDFIIDRTLRADAVLRSAALQTRFSPPRLRRARRRSALSATGRSCALVDQEVYPALERQSRRSRACARAVHAAGVGHLPQGHGCTRWHCARAPPPT